jgi:putative nucleotidyltransferase with HDIG domain
VIDLDAVSRAAGCFEPLPTSAIRLAALVARDIPDIARIVEVVRYDQALTAALLRRANSSWSAPRTEITTVQEAVVRIGAGPVVALALGVNVRARLQQAIPAYGLGEGELWNHSVAATLAAESLMRAAKRRLPTETPTAALLHDVGKLVMARFVEAEHLEAIEARRSEGSTRLTAETEVLGVDHAQLGGMVARAWCLPDSLVAGIERHHATKGQAHPDSAELIGYAVHVSDVVAKAVGGGADDNAEIETFSRAMGELGLSADDYDEVCGAVRSRFAEVASQFS